MKKVIVTGGSGFIGSWLVEELLKNSIEVTVIVRDKTKLLESIRTNKKCVVVEKSVEQLSYKDFKTDFYDVFFHMAWNGVSTEFKDNIEMQISNITQSIYALELCNKIRCPKFIAAGTVAEYVFCDDVMDVNLKQTPNDMYGAAKVSTHYFLEVRARQLNQVFNWLVIPSTFGERRNDNNIITYTIRTLLQGMKPQYGNLSQMWDFLYVGDVVRAIRMVGERGRDNKIYGIGSGEYYPLRKYIETIRDLIDPKLELGIGDLPQMSKKTFSSCVNIDELVEDTGFKPSITFEEGIKRTIRYIKEHM